MAAFTVDWKVLVSTTAETDPFCESDSPFSGKQKGPRLFEKDLSWFTHNDWTRHDDIYST